MRNIYKVLVKWKDEAKYNKSIQFKYDFDTKTLFIYTFSPGVLIGKAGYLFDKYLEMLKKEQIGLRTIEFVETNYFDIV